MQQTLFQRGLSQSRGEAAEVELEKKQEQQPAVKDSKGTDEQTKAYSDFIDECEANNTPFRAVLIEAIVNTTLSGTTRILSTSISELAMWGCGGDYQSEDEILGEKQTVCKDCYFEDDEMFFTTQIRAENIRLFVTDQARVCLEQRGIDIDGVIEKWTAIQNTLPSEEQIRDFARFTEIRNALHSLGCHITSSEDIGVKKEIDILNQAIRAKLGMREKYGNKLEQCPLGFSENSIQELLDRKAEIVAKGKELEREGNVIVEKYRPGWYEDGYFNDVKSQSRLD